MRNKIESRIESNYQLVREGTELDPLCFENTLLTFPGRFLWGSVAQFPWSPEPLVTEVFPLWAVFILLLWLGRNCCGHTSWGSWYQAWLAASLGCDCRRCAVDGANPQVGGPLKEVLMLAKMSHRSFGVRATLEGHWCSSCHLFGGAVMEWLLRGMLSSGECWGGSTPC